MKIIKITSGVIFASLFLSYSCRTGNETLPSQECRINKVFDSTSYYSGTSSLEYNLNGQVEKILYSGTNGSSTTIFSFNSENEMVGIISKDSKTNSVLSSGKNTFDLHKRLILNVTSGQEGQDSTKFIYDSNNRIISKDFKSTDINWGGNKIERYEYDAYGNLSKVYSKYENKPEFLSAKVISIDNTHTYNPDIFSGISYSYLQYLSKNIITEVSYYKEDGKIEMNPKYTFQYNNQDLVIKSENVITRFQYLQNGTPNGQNIEKYFHIVDYSCKNSK